MARARKKKRKYIPAHEQKAQAALKRFWSTRAGLKNWEGFTDEMYLSECKTCKRCGEFAAWAEPDPCLGTLPGVKFACCGHGEPYEAGGVPYVVFKNNVVIRGEFHSIERGPLGHKLTDCEVWKYK